MDLAWWIAVIGVPLIGAIFAVDFYIHRDAQTERERLVAEKNAEIAMLHARIGNLGKEFNDYKVNSAMLFATATAVSDVKRELVNMMGEMKREMSTGLTYIAEKLDRIVERNDQRDRHS